MSFYCHYFTINLQIFSGSSTSGNVTVPLTDVLYGVQVTASIQLGDNVDEGRLSNISSVYVPTPGI